MQQIARWGSSIFLVLILSIWSSDGHASKQSFLGPLTVQNQNPLYLQNLGLTPKHAVTLPHGILEWRMDVAFSNVFEKAQSPDNLLLVDTELWRTSMYVHYAFKDDILVGLQIPFYHTGNGFLDSFIQGYHHAFGLPNGGRDTVPNNQFSYRIQQDPLLQHDFLSMDLGLGDIVLELQHQLIGEDSKWPSISWFAELKFPTGMPSKGLGSGRMDFGLGLAIEASYKKISAHVNAAYYVIGGHSKLEHLMFDQMLAYMVAGEIAFNSKISGIIQFSGSTPLYHGLSMDPFDGVPLDVTVGVKGMIAEISPNLNLIWQTGFSEDITSIGPSVDFTAFFSVGLQFDMPKEKKPIGDWLALRN